MTNVQNIRSDPASRGVFRHSSFVIRHFKFVCGSLWLSVALLMMASPVSADWLMGRGNPSRTGTDELRAPTIQTPKVRWAFKAKEHFLGAPALDGNMLFLTALGEFNTGQIHAVAIDDVNPTDGSTAKIRPGVPVWNKSAPFIKLPVASSPAIYGGTVIIGDGMHQTDGAVLYCFDELTGRALWRYDMEGKLLHMEGAPVVDPTYPGGTAVLIGAGDGGVLAIAANRATLEGKEVDMAELRKVMDRNWAELMKQYDTAKRKDPDFAVPPTDDALPHATPIKLWQKGEKQWHVDAPLLLTQNKIIVCSAYLDDEKLGRRAVFCLDRKSGETLWEREVEMNPWGGASVDGDMVIIAGSTIRQDQNLVDKARGMVGGIDILTGRLNWVRRYNGGVLAAPAIVDGMAIFAATDGTVRAVSTLRGADIWSYTATTPEAKQPFFAGVAVAGNTNNRGVVYAADLGGVLHAISVTDGRGLWTFDVGRDPLMQAPGMIFSAPVVKGQEIFLATCNVQDKYADQPCAVVSICDKDFRPGVDVGPKVVINKEQRRLEIPARVAPRKLASLKDIYPLEVVCTWPTPAGQKAHETVVITEVKPSEVQAGLEALGLKPGQPSFGAEDPTGPEVTMSLVLPLPSGKQRVVPLEKTIIDKVTGKTLPPLTWHFTGSAMRQLDPSNPTKVYGADLSGTFATIYPVTAETVIQGNLRMTDQSMLKLEHNRDILPEENAEVKLLIEVKP
ncbi:MAG: PQQ-like beta-propeller repeat protein [Phycisphaerales bacterium]|nr:PQQ-like beta-propeller repeat protein [Phycisphaerales bacterium]